ncbi:MAG: phosphoribosylanthranilate isomerase [Sphingobacteriales bacterium]|nr:MAG: phosphoribosylanthranilate isomerase [Sphingobacteriales bacterium]
MEIKPDTKSAKALKIKVCGMKYAQNISQLNTLEPNFIGFIFYPPSKRFVGLDFDKSVLSSVPNQTLKTAVFVNATQGEVIEFAHLYGMQAVQLHGNESPQFCAAIKASGLTLIKAFGIADDFDWNQLKDYETVVDYFLWDTKTEIHGGSGKQFDWKLLDKYKLNIPFFLSGGISLDNLADVKKIDHPQFYGIDLNSKFETEPGIKNIEKLEKAFLTLR